MRSSDCKDLSGRARPVAGLSAAVMVAGLSLCMLTACGGPVLTFPGAAVEKRAEPESTGSIDRPPTRFGRGLDEEDWRRAHAALSVALDPQGNGQPVKWDNPATAAHGAISPAGLPYVAHDEVCRDFTASVVTKGGSRSLRGTGCKPSGAGWLLKRVRPA